VQTIHSPEDEKRAYYSKMQESTRKTWNAHPSKLWSSTIMANIMYACIIMHNMIFEDESSKENLEPLFEVEAPTDFTRPLSFEALVVGTKQLESIDQHYSMRGDLVEHLWTLKGLSTY
jgi:hypothetical protein